MFVVLVESKLTEITVVAWVVIVNAFGAVRFIGTYAKFEEGPVE